MRFDPEEEEKVDQEKINKITRKVALALAVVSTYYWFIKIVFL
ncbi:hypothetical protein [Pedobacter sp. SYSU D00535]|nr:hypothetical protein [Pedobacter sp. SYSU D00535]